MTDPKIWKKIKIFNTYKEASDLKEELLAADEENSLLVKIRRCGDGGTQFKVKSWSPPEPKNNKKRKKKND